MNRKYLISILCLVTFINAVKGQTVITEKTNPVFLDVGNNETGTDHYSEITITWISPLEAHTVTNKNRMKLKIGIKSPKGIKNVKVLLNEESLVGDRGFGIAVEDEKPVGFEQFDKVVEKELFLSGGENVVTIVAENNEGEELKESRTIKFDEISLASLNQTNYALIFATDKYDYWDDLTNPVNDARTIAEELEKNYGYKVELVTNPSTTEILLKLKEYAQKSYLEYDQLFVFIAGHGFYDETFKSGYLVGKNSRRDDEARTTYLSHSVLRDAIENIPSKHTFLTMDVCFGGTFDNSIASAGHRGGDGVYRELNIAEFVKRKLRYKTRQYLTSGGKEYVPDGRPGMHSPFARKFIEALRSYGGQDKVLTVGEILTYVERIDPEPRAGEFGSNEPGSDFLFVVQE